MGAHERPWGSAEEAALLDGFAAGTAPVTLCRSFGRTPEEVGRRLSYLLGDESRDHLTPGDPWVALDVLWLRVRVGVVPEPLTPDAVADLWEEATGTALTMRQRAGFVLDPTTTQLAARSRYGLRVTAPEVIDRTGMLDLDDWLAACDADDPDSRLPRPELGDPHRPLAAHTLLSAVVADVAPAGARRALEIHLRLRARASAAESVPHRRAVLDVVRAASSRRPAALLRDHLLDPRAVEALARDLGGGLALTTTLALLGGRDEPDALRLAGRSLSPWRTPPNLGRGVVVRSPLT